MEVLPSLLEFDWNAGNENKNFLKHQVTNEETEEIFSNEPILVLRDQKHSAHEERFLLLGITNNDRRLSVIFTIRSNKVRVISARDMDKKERKFYEETTKTNTSI
ncbi:MAG: BrnT family toxin [Patescibacteria group bacterium]